MPTRTIPSFVGKIRVEDRNKTIYFHETTGAVDLSANIATGVYWPADLALAIAAAMGGASSQNGYTCTFDPSTGFFTITRSSGSSTWYPKVKNTDTNNLLSGGHQDVPRTGSANTLAAGQVSLNHLGFPVVSSYPSAGTSFTSSQICANTWIPNEPPARDQQEQFVPFTIDARAASGAGKVYDFGGPVYHDVNDPDGQGSLTSVRPLEFEVLDEASQTQFLRWFFRTWAGRGGVFRFYVDKDQSDNQIMDLAPESRQQMGRGERMMGYDYYSMRLVLRRAEDV